MLQAIAGDACVFIDTCLMLPDQDDDPYVRKTAAVCVAKLYDINPELVEDRGFLDLLKVLSCPLALPISLHIHLLGTLALLASLTHGACFIPAPERPLQRPCLLVLTCWSIRAGRRHAAAPALCACDHPHHCDGRTALVRYRRRHFTHRPTIPVAVAQC